MSEFDKLFAEVPVAASTRAHWKKQSPEHLDGAARVIAEQKANPWVFSADAHHFDQFAEEADWRAMARMSRAQQNALLDWD